MLGVRMNHEDQELARSQGENDMQPKNIGEKSESLGRGSSLPQQTQLLDSTYSMLSLLRSSSISYTELGKMFLIIHIVTYQETVIG